MTGESHALLLSRKKILKNLRRAQLPAELEKTYQLLEALVETVDCLLVLTELDGRIVLFNRACEELTGYSRQEALGRNIMELLAPPAWKPVVEGRFADPFAPELRLPQENPWRTRSGEERLIEWRCAPVWSPVEQRHFMLGAGLDITDRRAAEEQRRQADQEKSLILDSLSEMLAYQDLGHRIVWANRAAADSLGLPVEEMLGRTCHELWRQRPDPCPNCPLRKVAATGEPHQGEMVNAAGRIWEIRGYPVRDGQGQLVGVLQITQDVTALRKAEFDVRKKEREFFTLVGNIPAMVFRGYIDGAIDFYDNRIEEMLGYRKEDFDARRLTWMDIIKPDDLEGVKEVFLQALKTDRSYVREYRVRHARGRPVWIEERSRIFLTPEGKVDFVEGVFYEITEKKRLEEIFQDQFHFLQTLMDTIPSPIFFKDAAGRYLGGNAAFARYLGRDQGEIVGKTVFDLYPPESAELHHRMDQALFERPGVKVYESQVQDAEGRVREVEFRKATFTHRDGSLGGLVGVILDLTDQKRREAALRRAHADMKQLMGALPSILISLSGDGFIIQWNHSAERVFGLTSREVWGQPLSDIGLNWDEERVAQGLAAAWETGRPLRLDDVAYRRRDGKDGFLGLTLSPIHDDEGKPAGLLLLGADITERRILQSQLAQAQKLESIGQLAAGIAHEINTPIQYVGDNTRFLRDAFGELTQTLEKLSSFLAGLPPETALERVREGWAEILQEADVEYFLQEIPPALAQSLEGVERVARIVRAMKDFSHPGAREKKATDLNRALENTITVARNEWKYAADVVTHFEADLPLVQCLPGEMNQVFLNLLVNAAHAIGDVVDRDAGEKGVITVTTRTDGRFVEVRVADSGPGIPEEIRGKIFDPFFTTKEVGKGTGQGLAIAYRVITEQHGGSITFDSEAGRGATFILRLPVGENAGAEDRHED